MTIAERPGSAAQAGMSVERHSIDHIPAAERHGKVASLFPVWFAANMQVTTIVTGALGVILGLTLPWAIVALTLGNLFGAVFMALHSAQGPKLGIPQMIQSRAQFGYYGAIVPLLLVMPLYVGFFASGVVLGGHALAAGIGSGFAPAAIALSRGDRDPDDLWLRDHPPARAGGQRRRCDRVRDPDLAAVRAL